ncbi:MAG: M14 family metallopeptidase [Planctomycetota bacterium]|nr:M14 family metallopeptidase [Planctomycetota bacterium]
MHTRFTTLLGSLTGALVVTTIATTLPAQDYRNHDGLSKAVNDLAQMHEACSLDVIGSSRKGRGLYLLTLTGDPETSAKRPALLITAGLDGRHLVGTETALRVASNLLENHLDLLDEMTVYIIPRLNPDGTELNLGDLNAGHIGTVTGIDADRDGTMNEDGPNDLNGDGLITMMRRLNPSLDEPATHLADPVEPRLHKTPDWTKEQRATYTLHVEGVDEDEDGLIAEDGPGSVDLDKNFMHGWDEYALESGAYPLSEPESHALATFVLTHTNIVSAITYGRHDTLVNPPDGKGKDITGRAPKNIDAGDVKLYKEISKLYKEITDQSNAPKGNSSGSFHAWLYAQRGIPSFATVVWGRPGDAKEKDTDDGEKAAASGDATAEGSWTGVIEIPDMGVLDFTIAVEGGNGPVTADFSTPMFSIAMEGTFDESSGSLSLKGDAGPEQSVLISGTIEGNSLSGSATGPDGDSVDITATREGAEESEPSEDEAEKADKDKKDDKPSDAEAAAWLKYSDEHRDGAGFVEWKSFDHPTLGAIEIGGFVPGFRMNPPADELDDLAGKQTEFAVALMGKRPKLNLEGPDVTKLASGLYEIHFAIVNDGFLPTRTTMARTARSFLPTIVTLSVPVESIVTGDRINRSWGITGSGGRQSLHWILRVEDGSDVSIDITNPQLGQRTVTFEAK